MAFLTLEDPNAKIKGSRDPLGMVPIWSSFARHIVTNLTTPSTSVRGFTTLILARYLTNLLIERGTIQKEEALDVFLRMEQLSAYARYVGHETEEGIRGIEKIKGRYEEGKGFVPIQANRKGMILSDQKVYGLWGLYSSPARVSGLITPGPLGIEDRTRTFIEEFYFPRIKEHLNPLMKIISRGGSINTKRGNDFFKALINIMPEQYTPGEEDFYGKYLRDAIAVKINSNGNGEDFNSRQKNFSILLEKHSDLQSPLNREEVVKLEHKARKVDEGIADSLSRIGQLEALLAPADALFAFLLTQEGFSPKEAGGKLYNLWGKSVPHVKPSFFRELLQEIKKASSKKIATIMSNCCNALSVGDYTTVVQTLIEWNAKVMEGRNAGPWVKLSKKGKIDVRYRGLNQEIPKGDDVPLLWRNSYFVDSLKSIAFQLRNVK
jgi:hypothetical protein|tara:strand:- start:944 stop:2248 length:1305 start_codon:yes stop_codon:yes gene_type:complete